MNERLKLIRQYYKLSQEKFGEKLGVGKTAISKLESGENKITESMIKLVCREFEIDYIWFTQGIGGTDVVILQNDSDIIDKIDRIMFGENSFHKALMYTCASMNEEQLKSIEQLLDKFIEEKNKF